MCSNHDRMTVMSEKHKGKISLSGYEVLCDLRGFLFGLGGFGWVFLVPCDTAPIGRAWDPNVKNFIHS